MYFQKPPPGTFIDWSHPVSRGLIACLLFNEDGGDKVYDLCGNANDGTISAATWDAGVRGPTLLFNGTSAFVTVSNSPELNPGQITIVTRVLRTSGVGGINFVDKPFTSHNPPFYQYALQHFQAGVSFNVDVNGTLKSTTAANTPVPLGESHVIAATYDGATLRIYRDGVETDTTVAAGSITAYATDLKIGRVANAASYFPGQIEFVFLYNRALSASEIAELYANPHCFFYESQIPFMYRSLSIWEDPLLASVSTARTRHPTFSVFAELQGDITGDGVVIEFSQRAEDSLLEPNYGTGSIVITDKEQKYIDNGRSVFRPNDKVMIFAGFEGSNIPRFSAVIREIAVESDAQVQTLTIAEQGYRLKKSKTSGDYSAYNTPKKLVDRLAFLAAIGDVIYEDETGPPTTFTFGDTDLSLRSYWAMIHGAALCMNYIQFFDSYGRLNLTRRTSFRKTDYVFTDSYIEKITHKQVAKLINHKIIDYVHGIRPEFLAGDNVRAGQHTRSGTDAASIHRYGEQENQETDELIGTWTNAGLMIEQILDYFPFLRNIYTMKMPAIPLLRMADQIFIDSRETGIKGYFIIMGIHERISITSYSGRYLLISEGERF